MIDPILAALRISAFVTGIVLESLLACLLAGLLTRMLASGMGSDLTAPWSELSRFSFFRQGSGLESCSSLERERVEGWTML